MTTVKCPCLGCSYTVQIGEGYFHYTEKQAFEKMKEHILKQHSLGDVEEWLERCLAKHIREVVLLND